MLNYTIRLNGEEQFVEKQLSTKQDFDEALGDLSDELKELSAILSAMDDETQKKAEKLFLAVERDIEKDPNYRIKLSLNVDNDEDTHEKKPGDLLAYEKKLNKIYLMVKNWNYCFSNMDFSRQLEVICYLAGLNRINVVSSSDDKTKRNQSRSVARIRKQNSTNKNYNELLRKKRKEKGLTVNEIAEQLGISVGAYYNYENIKNIPSPEVMERMADYFDTPKEELFPMDLLLLLKNKDEGDDKHSKTRAKAIENYALNESIRKEYESDPANQVVQKEQNNNFNVIISVLSERERKVIDLYYGLDGEKPHTLQGIADILDVTRERARQILNKALKKMHDEARRRKIMKTDFFEET